MVTIEQARQAKSLLETPVFWSVMEALRTDLLNCIGLTSPSDRKGREDAYKTMMAAGRLPTYLKGFADQHHLEVNPTAENASLVENGYAVEQ